MRTYPRGTSEDNTLLEIRRTNKPEPEARTMIAEIAYTPDTQTYAAQDHPIFTLSQYAILKTQADGQGDHIYEIVNRFFLTLRDDEQRRLYNYYQSMHKHIQRITDLANQPASITPTEGAFRAILESMIQETTRVITELMLPVRLIQFVIDANFPFPDLSSKQMRSHDTAAMTFEIPEYIELTAISLLTKLMSPIWAEMIASLLISHAEGRRVTGEMNKELFCFNLIIPTLDSPPFQAVHNKFRIYLNSTIASYLKKTNTATTGTGGMTSTTFVLAKNGYDLSRYQETVYAIVVTRKFMTHNVLVSHQDPNDPPNLVRYLHNGIETIAQSKMIKMQSNTRMMPRHDLPEGQSGAEKDNKSYNDNVARVSKSTADIPIMARIGAMNEITKTLARYQISADIHRQAVEYHHNRGLQPSQLNRSMAASFYGRALGGSTILQYLPASIYIPLIVALQMVVIGRGMIDLGVLLVCNTAENRRIGTHTPEGARVFHSTTTTVEFRRCQELFSGSSERIARTVNYYDINRKRQEADYINIRSQIERIMTWVIDIDHYHNTSPAIWTGLGATEPPSQGSLIHYPENIMQQFCQFLIDQHDPNPGKPR